MMMVKADVADLITLSPEAEGVGIERTETARRVFCTVKSIGMQEAYQAMATGLNPEIKIVLQHDFEYQDEPELDYAGKRYKIIRTYVTEADGIELTCQRVTGNARGGV
jgi:SPP1 family predicted phage head-tail adaptor